MPGADTSFLNDIERRIEELEAIVDTIPRTPSALGIDEVGDIPTAHDGIPTIVDTTGTLGSLTNKFMRGSTIPALKLVGSPGLNSVVLDYPTFEFTTSARGGQVRVSPASTNALKVTMSGLYVSTGGGGTSYTGGVGISVTSNVIAADLAGGTGISVNGSVIAVDLTGGIGISINGATLAVDYETEHFSNNGTELALLDMGRGHRYGVDASVASAGGRIAFATARHDTQSDYNASAKCLLTPSAYLTVIYNVKIDSLAGSGTLTLGYDSGGGETVYASRAVSEGNTYRLSAMIKCNSNAQVYLRFSGSAAVSLVTDADKSYMHWHFHYRDP